MRTAFNLLGPLTNPAGAAAPAGRRAAAGADRAGRAIARRCSASERAWVVHGADGLDEISTTGYTKVSECRDGAVNTFYLHPADVGLPKAAPRGAARRRRRATTPRIARAVLGGEPGAPRDIVLLNAGASLLIAGAGVDASQDGLSARGGGARQRRAAAASSSSCAASLERDAGGG